MENDESKIKTIKQKLKERLNYEEKYRKFKNYIVITKEKTISKKEELLSKYNSYKEIKEKRKILKKSSFYFLLTCSLVYYLCMIYKKSLNFTHLKLIIFTSSGFLIGNICCRAVINQYYYNSILEENKG